jgi:hypothetical protein
MKVLNYDTVDVPQAALAELPAELLNEPLRRLQREGVLLVRNGGSKPILFRLQPVELDGAVITAVGEAPPVAPKAKTHKRGGRAGARWCKVTKAQAKTIGKALRSKRGEKTRAAFGKQLGVSANAVLNYERGRLTYVSKTLGDSLKRLGLGKHIPAEGGN